MLSIVILIYIKLYFILPESYLKKLMKDREKTQKSINKKAINKF